MIVYVTGAPGAGKSLWTISEVRKMQQAEPDRPVYYFNIPEVAPELGWHELPDVEGVHELPPKSIVIVDEAWGPWPQRKPGSPTPPNVELFATHRHRGHDFFLLTQRVTSVDHFLRGLVGRHVHLERPFGLGRARVYEWQKLGDPGDWHSRKDARSFEFWYPKDVFRLYKSADVHVVKKSVPWVRVAAIPAGVVLALAVGWWGISKVFEGPEGTGGSSSSMHELDPYALEQGPAGSAPRRISAAPAGVALDAQEWAERFEERVPGHPYSARFYDGQLVPATMPRISGCLRLQVEGIDRCRCYTQQQTTIWTMSHGQCVWYMAHGWFDPTKPDGGGEGGGSRRSTQQASAPAPQPIAIGAGVFGGS